MERAFQSRIPKSRLLNSVWFGVLLSVGNVAGSSPPSSPSINPLPDKSTNRFVVFNRWSAVWGTSSYTALWVLSFSYNLGRAHLLLSLIFLIGEQGLDLLISNLPAFRFSWPEICNFYNPIEKEGVTWGGPSPGSEGDRAQTGRAVWGRGVF